jgi:hypothetical protein
MQLLEPMIADEFIEGPFDRFALRPRLGKPYDLVEQLYGDRKPRYGAPSLHQEYTSS